MWSEARLNGDGGLRGRLSVGHKSAESGGQRPLCLSQEICLRVNDLLAICLATTNLTNYYGDLYSRESNMV